VQHKPTFEKPAYVVVAHKADPGDIRKVQGTGEDELGVTRAVGKDEVVEVWRGTPVAIAAGDYSVSDRGDGIYEDGSSSPPRADLMWELVQGAGAGAKPPELFKPDETAGLPKTGSQPFTDQKTLYDAARPALDQLKTWLDKGSGVATANGVKLMDKGPGDLTDEEWAAPGAMLFVAGLKGEKRAGEKVAADYGGDWSQLRDVVRCSLAFDTMTDLQTLLDKMKGSGMVLAQQPKDRFQSPTAEGYRDLMMNVTLPNGMIAEVQMHLKAMLVAKNQGHKYYETIRTIAAKPEKEWTPDERTAAQEAQASSQKLYGDAWTQAGGA
jgi:hypothetical protein